MRKHRALTLSIIIVMFFIIIIANYIYRETNYFEKILVCVYNSEYTNYTETLNFAFVSDVLYEFTRDEYLKETEEHTLDELFEYFKEQKESISSLEGDNFTYEVALEDDSVHIKTYISALNDIDFYEDYIENKDLDFDDTIDEIINDLEDYTCSIVKRQK